MKDEEMNWVVFLQMAFMAVLAIGLIAYSTSRIREVEAASEERAAKAAENARREARVEYSEETQRLSGRVQNLEVLRDLQERFRDRLGAVTVFGSTVASGQFAAPRPYNNPDVDLMIEVDEKMFASWATMAYEGRSVGDERQFVSDYNSYPHEGTEIEVMGRSFVIAPYSSVSPTRLARRWAAEEILGVKLERDSFGYPLSIDIFLFPHSFVRGELAIPAWDGTAPEAEGRSFRDEVLAGVKLADLEPE